MTKQEYQQIRYKYVKLAEKENKSELEELEYTYLDKVITYIDLRNNAIKMGNKTPDENFLIKDVKECMMKAQERLFAMNRKEN